MGTPPVATVAARLKRARGTEAGGAASDGDDGAKGNVKKGRVADGVSGGATAGSGCVRPFATATVDAAADQRGPSRGVDAVRLTGSIEAGGGKAAGALVNTADEVAASAGGDSDKQVKGIRRRLRGKTSRNRMTEASGEPQHGEGCELEVFESRRQKKTLKFPSSRSCSPSSTSARGAAARGGWTNSHGELVHAAAGSSADISAAAAHCDVVEQ